MGVIEKARELGEALLADERCIRLQNAKAANDADTELQNLIGEFNLKKFQLNNEFNKKPEEQSKEKIEQYQKELKDIYGKIMATEGMKEYAAAKKDVDELLSHINSIIQMSITGEVDGGGCGGNCSACGGCH